MSSRGKSPLELAAGQSSFLEAFEQLYHIVVESYPTTPLLRPTHLLIPAFRAAMCSRNTKVCCFLLATEFSKYILDNCKETFLGNPLQAACYQGMYEVAEMLLDLGADPDDVSETAHKPLPPLNLASMQGHLDIVKLLIKYGAGVNKIAAVNIPALTALHAACSGNHDQVARYLVNCGANASLVKTFMVDFAYNVGCASLFTELGYHVVRKICKDGVNIQEMQSLVDLDIELSEHAMMQILKFSFDTADTIGCAAIQCLFEAGYVLDGDDLNFWTDTHFLFSSFNYPNDDYFFAFIERGVVVNFMKCLAQAINHDKLSIAEYLSKETGVSVKLLSNDVHLSTCMALEDISDEAWQYLVDNDFNVDLRRNSSHGVMTTHLVQACAYGCVKAMERLVLAGAKVNTEDESLSLTALHCAASFPDDAQVAWRMVLFLLDHGADPTALDGKMRNVIKLLTMTHPKLDTEEVRETVQEYVDKWEPEASSDDDDDDDEEESDEDEEEEEERDDEEGKEDGADGKAREEAVQTKKKNRAKKPAFSFRFAG